MRTNIDHHYGMATNGCRVRIRANQPEAFWDGVPSTWSREGIVRGIELDSYMSELNKKGIRMYRILVDFGDQKIASLLPCLLVKSNV